jgi:hypothetical protein
LRSQAEILLTARWGISTHSQKTYGVDAFPVTLSVTHDCCIAEDLEEEEEFAMNWRISK